MYTIKKLDSNNISKIYWDDIQEIKIENYPWDQTGYKPKTSVKLCYTDEELRVRFTSCEKQVRVEVNEFNGPSYKDSCVEFFFLPDHKKDDRYFNFEITAKGNLLLQLGPNGADRHSLDYINPNYFEIKADVTSENYRDFDDFKPWNVEYKIPFEFIKDFFVDFEGKSGHTLKCNFSKCGDKTLTPHYGTWAKIEHYKPAFHKPEYFNEIVFE